MLVEVVGIEPTSRSRINIKPVDTKSPPLIKYFREYKKEQERVKMWKAEQARQRKKRREWRNIANTTIVQLVIVALIIAIYGVLLITI